MNINIHFIPELSIVAVMEDGTIVGEVVLHETDIITKNEKNTQLVLCQSAVFLGGDPKLYGRYGFEPSSKYGIFHVDRERWGDEGYMVCLLRAGALDGVTGTTSYYGG